MRMSALIKILEQTMEVYGDRVVTTLDTDTGEIRYVDSVSFDSCDCEITLESISWEDKKMQERMHRIEMEIEQDKMKFPFAFK